MSKIKVINEDLQAVTLTIGVSKKADNIFMVTYKQADGNMGKKKFLSPEEALEEFKLHASLESKPKRVKKSKADKE